MNTPSTGYPVKQFGKSTKRFVQTLSLRENAELIKEYRRLHSESEMWTEILNGIRQVGILEMEIYISGTRLVMIVETAADFDWNSSMSVLSQLPRQEEWENLVAKFQQALPGQSSSEKWQLMERMFYLYDK